MHHSSGDPLISLLEGSCKGLSPKRSWVCCDHADIHSRNDSNSFSSPILLYTCCGSCLSFQKVWRLLLFEAFNDISPSMEGSRRQQQIHPSWKSPQQQNIDMVSPTKNTSDTSRSKAVVDLECFLLGTPMSAVQEAYTYTKSNNNCFSLPRTLKTLSLSHGRGT